LERSKRHNGNQSNVFRPEVFKNVALEWRIFVKLESFAHKDELVGVAWVGKNSQIGPPLWEALLEEVNRLLPRADPSIRDHLRVFLSKSLIVFTETSSTCH